MNNDLLFMYNYTSNRLFVKTFGEKFDKI